MKTVVAAGHGHSSHGKDLVGTTWRSLRQVLRSSIFRCFGYGSRLESILCSLQGLYLDGITKYYSEFYDRRVQESATSLHRKSQYLSDPRAPVPHPGRISTLYISREGVNLCKLQRVERSKVKKLNDCEYYRIKACMTSTKRCTTHFSVLLKQVRLEKAGQESQGFFHTLPVCRACHPHNRRLHCRLQGSAVLPCRYSKARLPGTGTRQYSAVSLGKAAQTPALSCKSCGGDTRICRAGE